MSKPKTGSKEEAAKRQSAARPGKEDVHEQREQGQEREGVVRQPQPSPARERGNARRSR
jgi:hypothetical protein